MLRGGIRLQTKLQQQGCKSDGRDYDQCQWAEKCRALRIKDNQRESCEQQCRGEDGAPATGPSTWGGIGQLVGHRIPLIRIYTGAQRLFQIGILSGLSQQRVCCRG